MRSSSCRPVDALGVGEQGKDEGTTGPEGGEAEAREEAGAGKGGETGEGGEEDVGEGSWERRQRMEE